MDRIRPLKIESISGGGSQDNVYPHDMNPNEDGVEVRGVLLQNDTSDDEVVVVSRDASNNMTFEDGVVSGTKTLTELLSGSGGLTENSHRILRQLIHFIDDGPAEGFTSGAYREVTGTVFPTSIIWYTDSGKTEKIVEKNITWSGVTPTTIEWKMYDEDGSTLLVTVSDAITYSGIFETSRTRTITIE